MKGFEGGKEREMKKNGQDWEKRANENTAGASKSLSTKRQKRQRKLGADHHSL
jgi:hypothetical protein